MADAWIRSAVVSKQLLEQARVLTQQPDSGAIAAVLLADLAVETTAKAVIHEQPPANASDALNPKRDPSLSVVLDAVLASWREKEGNDQLSSPQISEARRLRDYRNLVMHDGEVPTDPDRHVARGEEFVRWAIRQFFGLEIEEISRAYLIRDEAVAARVRLAEQSAVDEQYLVAMGQLRVAFNSAHQQRSAWESFTFIDSEIERAVERATGAKRYSMGQQSISVSELMDVMKKMAKRLDEVDEIVQAISVGADPVEYAWFARTAPHTFGRFNTDHIEVVDDGEPRTRQDYARAYDFVLTTLLRWQQLPPHDPYAGWRVPTAQPRNLILPNPPEE
jgi:hypothetical protein